MPITQLDLETVKEIVIDGANRHFPPAVRFQDADVSIQLNAQEEEYIYVQLLYTAPNPVLDGHMMNTLFRVIDEPISNAGITARTLVGFTDINDPSRWQHSTAATPPAPTL